jgi:DNA-binding MarR family transcriptional regulator
VRRRALTQCSKDAKLASFLEMILMQEQPQPRDLKTLARQLEITELEMRRIVRGMEKKGMLVSRIDPRTGKTHWYAVEGFGA